MQSSLSTVNWRRILTILGIVALVVAAVLFASRIPRTLAIFIIAAFLASAVHPIVQLLERRRVPRIWAILSVYAVLILTVGVVAIVVIPLIFTQLQTLAGNVPDYLQGAQVWLNHLQDAVRARFPSAHLAPVTNIQQLGAQRINVILATVLTGLGTFALTFATGLFVALSALILSFFFLLNHRQIADNFAGIFPLRKRHSARQLATEIVGVFGGFIAGQVVVSAITGIAIALLSAAFHFKFALLLGLLSAICYAIPIVGMLVAHGFGLITAAPQGIGMVITVQVILFVVARVSDNVLVPKVMGDSVGVSPIGVMFAVFAGGELFGLPGLILGIPAAALIKLLWGYFIVPLMRGDPAETV